MSELAGHQISDGSWGSGKAVAPISRVLVVGPTVLAWVPLEMCAGEATCLHEPKPGITGTAE